MEAQKVGSATVLVTRPAELLGQPMSLSWRSHSGKPREPSLTPAELSISLCLTFPSPFPPMTLF